MSVFEVTQITEKHIQEINKSKLDKIVIDSVKKSYKSLINKDITISENKYKFTYEKTNFNGNKVWKVEISGFEDYMYKD